MKNNIYVYGIRGEGRSATRRAMALMAEKRFDATKIHTHTFALADLPTALRYARDRVEDAIKVVVTDPAGDHARNALRSRKPKARPQILADGLTKDCAAENGIRTTARCNNE